nr:hypothetical protein [Megavirus caiporensis]
MKRINTFHSRYLTPIWSTRMSTSINTFRSARIMRTKPIAKKIIDKFPIDEPEADQPINYQSDHDKYCELLNNYSEIKKKYNHLLQDENSYDKLVRYFNEEVEVSSEFLGTLWFTSALGWVFALFLLKLSNSK